jgi:RNA-splicing ligase RtcB
MNPIDLARAQAGAPLTSVPEIRAGNGAGLITPDVTVFPGKLRHVSLGEPIPSHIRASLERLAAQPYVEAVVALPDIHWKEAMEVPSSIAIETRDIIVPEFTSVAVNDGMGVVRTGLDARDMTAERMTRFFSRINSHSASNFFETNRYSIGTGDFRRVLTDGARALLGRYDFEPDVLDAMEDGGRMRTPGQGAPLGDVVPLPLLHTKFSRSEMGLNFGGNHFLEIQAVDEMFDESVAARWGFRKGEVVVMYHLGPGPFGGTLLNHYADREKLQASRRPLFFASKLVFHYLQRMGRGHAAAKWAAYFQRNGWTPVLASSEEGVLLRQAFAMAINFGYGYRLATMAAIRDALQEVVSTDTKAEVFCDISHNGVTESAKGGSVSWVARHNACRLHPGGPTIVAGTHDVPSYLGLGGNGQSGRLHSYDHGGGHLIDGYRERGELDTAEGRVLRVKMTRGRNARIVRHEDVPMRTAAPMERLMRCFEQHDIMRPVLRLRPLGNLKN